MEQRITILENFWITSIIMPFYGKTHKMFLLLSSLYSGSRHKLNEFYPEFRKWMRDYWLEITIDSDTLQNLFLPSDLFWLTISYYFDSNMDIISEFISNLIAK